MNLASGSRLGIDATKVIPGEGFKRPWPPLIKMDAAVKAKVEKLFNPQQPMKTNVECRGRVAWFSIASGISI